MRNASTPAALVIIALVLVGANGSAVRAQDSQVAAPAPVREITQLRGDLYEAREGDQYTVFLTTPDGIVLVDPLNVAFARWLKDEFATRFPGRPVRYVVLTHSHFDRAEGGGVFAGTPLVAHAQYNSELFHRDRAAPFLGVQDRNDNGQFEPDELEGPNAPLLRSRDRNHDGTVTTAELYGLVMSVRNTYGDRRTITVGGKQVQLVHTGNWHSPDMTALLFPEERIVFAVDPPPITGVPFSFGVARAGDVYDWLHAIVSLDFDTLVLGDGRTVPAATVRSLTSYLDALRAGVLHDYERGRSREAIQATALPEQYRGAPQYAGRTEQIAAVYRTLRLRRVAISATGLANYGRRDPGFCASYTFCSAGGIVPSGTAGVSFLLGKKIGVVGEVTLTQQSWSTRRQPLYDEEIALQQTRGSVLFRFSPRRWLALLGGPSFVYADAQGINIVRGRVVPIGGRHEIHSRVSSPGVAAGLDLSVPFGARVSLVLPIRVLYTAWPRDPDYWPGHIDATAGMGLSVTLARSVN